MSYYPPKYTSPKNYTVTWTIDGATAPVSISCHRSWSPNGSDRLYSLVQSGFFNGGAFFRVVPGYIAQWGLSSDPFLNSHWDDPIADDPTGVQSNLKGTISFATAGPETRTTQVRRTRRGKNRCVLKKQRLQLLTTCFACPVDMLVPLPNSSSLIMMTTLTLTTEVSLPSAR